MTWLQKTTTTSRFDTEFVMNSSLIQDTKKMSRQELLKYIEDLEFHLIQTTSSISCIENKVIELNNLGYTIDEPIIKGIITNALKHNKI